MPPTAAKRISPAAPHRNKAARALHRTAPNTTADCAVPPLFHQSTKPEIVAYQCNNIGARGAVWPRSESRGWPCGKATAKLTALQPRAAENAKRASRRVARQKPRGDR